MKTRSLGVVLCRARCDILLASSDLRSSRRPPRRALVALRLVGNRGVFEIIGDYRPRTGDWGIMARCVSLLNAASLSRCALNVDFLVRACERASGVYRVLAAARRLSVAWEAVVNSSHLVFVAYLYRYLVPTEATFREPPWRRRRNM